MNASKQGQVFKCNVCGNIIQALQIGGGELVCCGQSMELLVEKFLGEGAEKHVPIAQKTENGYKIKVGALAHPMDKDHYIQWIELIADGISYHKFLTPHTLSEFEFNVQAENVSVREYCNLHGLWRN